MKVLLINPKTEGYSRSVTTPLGLLSIATYLKENGIDVRLYDRTVEKPANEEVCGRFRPSVVGISLVSFLSYYDALLLSEYYHALGIPVFWGGPLASELPEAVLKNACVYGQLVGKGLYAPIRDLKEIANRNPMQKVEYNFSAVPARDLKVVHSYYMWRSFASRPVSVDGEKSSFTKKVARDALRSVRGNGVVFFFRSAFSAGTELLRIFFTRTFSLR